MSLETTTNKVKPFLFAASSHSLLRVGVDGPKENVKKRPVG